MLETLWLQVLNLKDPLLHERKKGWDHFQTIGWPTRRQEAFQYFGKIPSLLKLAERKKELISPREGLVFIDGFFEESLSILPPGVICLPMEQALRSYGLFLQSRMASMMKQEKDPFVALNRAFQGRGAFVYAPPKCKAALHITQIYTGQKTASPSLHLYLGQEAQVRLTQTSEGIRGVSNHLLDCILDKGANLCFIDHAEGDFQALRVSLKKESECKAVFLGKQLRHSIRAELTEERAKMELFGLSELTKEQEAHIHAHIEHIAPFCTSRQHFKSILREKSCFSFDGKIYVHPNAQKTEAYQLNNNLILSDEARANAKPNLEIFADDVKASHGATFGQLEEEELFYLRSRGFSRSDAMQWLLEGFCKEILDHAR